MENNNDQWDPCPHGELARMVQARHAQRRRRLIDRVAAAGACVMVAIAVGGLVLGLFTPQPESPIAKGPAENRNVGAMYGGISCADVEENMPAYIKAEQTNFVGGELDSATLASMTEHLDKCPLCKDHYDQLKVEQGISLLVDSAIFIAAFAMPQ